MNQLKHPVSHAMLERLRDEASAYSNFVDLILDDPTSQYGPDGKEVLVGILGLLIGLTGSENDAIAWLMNSRGYTDIIQSDVCVNLAHGDFWTLETLADWLLIIDTHRDLCPGLIEAVFRRGAASAGA